MKENSITINRKDNTTVIVSVLIVDWLPVSVKGLAIEDSDTEYTILLNGELSKDMLHSSFAHELEHIFHNDFNSDLSAGEIEQLRHHDKNQYKVVQAHYNCFLDVTYQNYIDSRNNEARGQNYGS